MTDQPEEQGPPRPASASVRTGDAGVDEVLSTLDRLDALAVEEHLPVFEQAHEALRRALNRPADGSGN